MTTRFLFRSDFHVQVIGSQRTVLFSEHSQFLLRGELCTLMVPHLSGSGITAEKLVDELSTKAAPRAVHEMLQLLVQKGYVLAEDTPHDENIAFWHSFGTAAGKARERLLNGSVRLVAVGETDVLSLEESFNLAGICSSKSDGVLDVLVVDDYLNPQVETHSKTAVRPWLLIKPIGRVVWFGPLFPRMNLLAFTALVEDLRKIAVFRWIYLGSSLKISVMRIRCAGLPLSN